MLIRFNVKNFLSFASRKDNDGNEKTEEFSMIAGKVRSNREHIFENEKIKLLKFAAIYGANASGKSNLVKALDFMRTSVISGLPKGHSAMFCKSDERNKTKSSYFEIEILLDKKIYSYGFEVLLSESRFISEWLVELQPEGNDKVLFERDIEHGTYTIGAELSSKGLADNITLYADDVSDDGSVLFLKVMNQNKRTLYTKYRRAIILRNVYEWINTGLDINYPNRPISDYSYMANNDNVKEICRIISAFGTGITDFQIVDVDPEKVLAKLPSEDRARLIATVDKRVDVMKKNAHISSVGLIMRSEKDFFIMDVNRDEQILCKTIQFSHGQKGTLFDLSEESDGTVRILDLLEILLSGENRTYVVDELDRCLHPSLTYKFVETFLHEAQRKNIQLIVTTHESRLLDFELLRRDEIWFVNKKENGESDIYSLEEYNERFDKKIDKAYLEGRYGGIPIFSTVFPVGEVQG